jgi:hypothetical protein
MVQDLPWAKTQDLIRKITAAKKDEGTGQVVECMPNKHKT